MSLFPVGEGTFQQLRDPRIGRQRFYTMDSIQTRKAGASAVCDQRQLVWPEARQKCLRGMLTGEC